MTQRQQLELVLRETEKALEELGKLGGDEVVYKRVGGILVRASKPDVERELNERKETLNLRIKTLERQEGRVVKRLNEMREKIQEALKTREPSGEAG